MSRAYSRHRQPDEADEAEADGLEDVDLTPSELAANAELLRREELVERLQQADQANDLLRNAVARRDALLCQQRTAYYRELLMYKSKDAQKAEPPAASLEAALDGPALPERPAFFDACVFEALHLSVDDPLASKAAAALRQAAAREEGRSELVDLTRLLDFNGFYGVESVDT